MYFFFLVLSSFLFTVETLTSPMKEETLDLHLHIKNSTLLDVSQAQNIHMHDPNISTISGEWEKNLHTLLHII